MFSISRCLRSNVVIRASERLGHGLKNQRLPTVHSIRSFSSQSPFGPNDPQTQFKAKPPTELNHEMAEGIQNANMLILKHGVGNQRLKLLAEDEEMPLVVSVK